MAKAKTLKSRYLPEWANEPLTFSVDPDEALRCCAYNKLPKKAKLTPKRRR